MKHVKRVSKMPQVAQTSLQIKLDSLTLILESGGRLLFDIFGSGSSWGK